MDRITADGRYGVRLGQTPEAAADELRACIEGGCAADPFYATIPRRSRSPAPVRVLVGARRAAS
jgi:hypothetical protein